MDVLIKVLRDTALICVAVIGGTLFTLLIILGITNPGSPYQDLMTLSFISVFLVTLALRYHFSMKREETISSFVEAGFSRREAELILSCPRVFARSLLLITAERYYDLLMREEPTAVRDEEREKELVKRKLEKLKEVIIGGV